MHQLSPRCPANRGGFLFTCGRLSATIRLHERFLFLCARITRKRGGVERFAPVLVTNVSSNAGFLGK
jgi:hypothetical protein